jgi:hypothetical protein
MPARILGAKAVALHADALANPVEQSTQGNQPDRPTAALRVPLSSKSLPALGIARSEYAVICTPKHQLPRSFVDLTAVLTSADEGGFIALKPETGTTT